MLNYLSYGSMNSLDCSATRQKLRAVLNLPGMVWFPQLANTLPPSAFRFQTTKHLRFQAWASNFNIIKIK
jgi:hypothetical protein